MNDNAQDHATPLHLQVEKHHSVWKKLLFVIPVGLLVIGGLYVLSQKTPVLRKLIPVITRTEPEEFKMVKSYPEDYDKSVSVRTEPTFVFSKKIDMPEKALNQYFKLTPSVEGAWHIEENGKVVYFSSNKKGISQFPQVLDPLSIYTITISKSLKSEGGEILAKNISVTFRTKANIERGYSVEKKLINTSPSRDIIVGMFQEMSGGEPAANIPAKITVYKSEKNEVLEYFKYKKGKGSLYAIKNKGSVVRTLDTTLAQGNSGLFMTIPPLEIGLYYLVAEVGQSQDDFFINVSAAIDHVIASDNKMEVWSTNSVDGKRLNGTKTELYSLDGQPKLLSTITANNDGLTTYEGSTADILVTHKDNNLGFIYTPRYNKYAWGETSDIEAFAYTDRPVYRPGDRVHYKAVVRGRENSKYILSKEKLYLKFLAQSNLGDDDYKEISVDENGTVVYDLKLPHVVLSSPSIILAAKNDDKYLEVNRLDLKIEAYRKPDIDIEVKTKEKEYVSSDTAHLSLYAKTMYGQPMSNVDYTYRVLAVPFTEIKDRTQERLGDFVFYGDGRELDTGKGKFSESGTASVEFNTGLRDLEDSQIVTLEVIPNLATAPSVGRVVKLVHRGEFAMFFSETSADLQDGVKGIIEVYNHQTPRVAVASQEINLTLYRNPYGNREAAGSQTVKSDQNGSAPFEFKDVSMGDYELVAKSVDARGNTVTSKYSMYVTVRQENIPGQPQYTLELKTSKQKVKAGETITIQGKANYPISDALAIVSGASNKGAKADASILQKQVVSINGPSLSFPLKVPAVDVPISVSFISTHNGEAVHAGAVIDVDAADKRITTSIKFDKAVVKPKDTVKAEIQTIQDGKAVSADTSLSIVDKAVLEIGKFNEVIFDAFYNNLSAPFLSYYNSATGIYNDREPGGGGGCFVEGTQILMEYGSTKNIEDIKLGEIILTRQSDFSSTLVPDKVIKVWRHVVDEYITVNKTFKVTPVHRVFINNEWIEMSKARVGDRLLDEHGNFVEITSIERSKGQYVVYNLTTEKRHTFFAGGFYVHNEKGMTPRQNFADTIYWNPHIKTDQDGKAEVTFKAPDNITTFTAQAFSNTLSAFGQGTAEIISRKDLVIMPALPNVIYKDDKPVLSAVVQNTTASDVEGTITLAIKELNFQKEQDIKIPGDGWTNMNFPTEFNINSKEATITFTLKGKGGTNLDGIQLTKKILPKGNIISSWLSFDGDKKVSFTPTHKDMETNRVLISTYSHPATALTYEYLVNYYVDDNPSAAALSRLYFQAYLLNLSEKGYLDPALYNYPLMKIMFRDTISSFLRQKVHSGESISWSNKYSAEESSTQLTGWMTLILKELQQGGRADQIEDSSQLIEQAARFVSENQTFPVLQNKIREYIYMSSWVLGKKVAECDNSEVEIECIAVQAMQGDGAALQRLSSLAIESADDRYVWIAKSNYGQALPALAMIKKGSPKEADKAIKGLAATYANYSYDGRALLYIAALDHAVRSKLSLTRPTINIHLNGEPLATVTGNKTEQVEYVAQIPVKNLDAGGMEIEFNQEGGTPVYTDIIFTDYTSNNTLSVSASGIEKERPANLSILRKLRKLDGSDTNTLEEGDSGIIELSIANPSTDISINGVGNKVYMIDGLNPGHMFLNQVSDNSPQYQSVLRNIYPGEQEYAFKHLEYASYSDQFISYYGSSRFNPITMPYVVYKLNKGTYHQPKTTVIFPQLGIVAREK